MRKPGPAGLTRDRAPGKPEGAPADPLGTRRLRARRGDDSVQVVSPWAYRPRGPQSPARAGSASPAVLGRQSSFQRLGSGGGGACAHDPGQALQPAAAPGRLPPNPRRARVVLATAAPRRSSSFLPRLGWCACVCVSVRARADTHVPPLHMHAPTYWPRRRREPWLPRMRHLPDSTPLGRTAARRARARRKAIDGQGAGKLPGLLLIAERY